MTDDKAPTRELMATFDECHRSKFGVPAYPLSGRQAKVLADLWRVYGTALVERLIHTFFEGNSWADDTGYSVSVFASQVPRTLMQLERQKLKVVRFDWLAECRELHGGRCGNPVMHDAEMHKAEAS